VPPEGPPPTPAPAEAEPQPAEPIEAEPAETVATPTVSEPTPAEAASAEPLVRVYLGLAPGAYGKPREIWFEPELLEQPLPNRHVPPVDLRSGRIAPMNHIHQLSEILKRIYRLGDQQTFQLREAIKEVYEIQGLGVEPTIASEEQTYLPFDAVREVLVRDGQ